VQDGHGVDSVFYAGTTGEWDRVDRTTREDTIRVCAEAISEIQRRHPVASWAGITAPTANETIDNLSLACDCGADAVVLSPLAIPGVADPVEFVRREIVARIERGPRSVPVLLYDNADIAADPARPYLSSAEIDALGRLDAIRGIKLSAPLEIVRRHAQAITALPASMQPALLVGYGSQIFDLFPVDRAAVRAADWLPAGLICGHANVLPREWARAWRAVREGDRAVADAVRPLLDALRDATFTPGGARPVIACFKRALELEGVVTSARVARGTPRLTGSDRDAFDRAWHALVARGREVLGAAQMTRVAARDLSSRGA
jgi:dihydrodipicolinate synthase/N-acetylneuraminate lyase